MAPRYHLGSDHYWRSRGYDPISSSFVPPADPYPALPNLPEVQWEDLFVSGDTPAQTVNRLTDYKVISLPDGFDEDFSDFTQPPGGNSYGLFSSFLLGFHGRSNDPTQARLRLAPLSSTQASRVPSQSTNGASNPLTLLRVGAGTSHLAQTMMVGMTLEGTRQPTSPNNSGASHNFAGEINYYGRNAIHQHMIYKLASVGDWNSPPGETFSINNFHDVGSIFRDVEVDGISTAGEQMGGSPLGGNNSQQILLEDCYLHDSRVSSLTFSIAGSITDANSSRDVWTKRCIIANNANHVLGPGTRFTGVNHENVMGYIKHDNIDITMTNMTEWNASHMSFVAATSDNPNIVITEPVWHQSQTRYNGMFVIAIGSTYAGGSNAQVSIPKVIKNGVTLTPNKIFGNGSLINLDPAHNFIVIAA